MSVSAKPTVYVVDDDAGVLGSLRFLLETDGFNVRTFSNGASLLNAVRSTGVDCFVIDYKMPDMNGIDLAGRLRTRDIAAPVILITGYPDAKIAVRAADAGVKQGGHAAGAGQEITCLYVPRYRALAGLEPGGTASTRSRQAFAVGPVSPLIG